MLSSLTFIRQLNAQRDINVPIKCYPEGHSWTNLMLSRGTYVCQLNAIQLDIHVSIKCYLEGHTCANLMLSSWTFMCLKMLSSWTFMQLNAIQWDIHGPMVH